MCGIVGYLGPREPKEVILQGLKRLEYRGYDSAGIAILNQGHLKRVRASGKLGELEKKLVGETFDGRLGIGHTRWATHGAPIERNAHPHQVSGVSLVHNGIIENYMEIREELKKTGAKIESDTDSELVVHLIARAFQKTKNLLKAVQQVKPQLRGAYSIVVVCEETPDEIVAFKSGPPLILGVGKQEMIVASDVQAVLPYTRQVVYLEDSELLHIKGTQWEVLDTQGKSLKRQVVEIDWSPDRAEKQGFKHFMLKEIFEQPRAVAAAINALVDVGSSQVTLGNLQIAGKPASDVFREIKRVQIVACGTSYYAGMIGEYLIETYACLPVEIEFASEYRYRNPVVDQDALVIVVSQSGETADTLAALRMAKSKGAKILSICNVMHSSIDREADGRLYMRSDVEIGVASTKAFTSTMAIFNLLALAIAKSRKLLDPKTEKESVLSLLSAPAQMEKALNYDKFFAHAAEKLKDAKGFLFLGRGVNFPIALEGALKLKELAYVHAEGYAAGEMKHGPIALIESSMIVVVVAPTDNLYEKTLSNLEEVRARGGRILSIGSGENDRLRSLSEIYLAIPEANWTINPLLAVIPLQLLAYHVADVLGHDVDQPRNLAKSVTVE